MYRNIVLFALASIMFFSAAASAAEKTADQPQVVPTPFDADGYSVMGKFATGECLVGSNIDLKAMLAHVADLQTRGLVRQDVDAAHVNAHAWTTATAVAFKIQPVLVTVVFDEHPEITHCGFVQTITGLDGKQQPAYGFDLTREQYTKTDWKALGPGALPDATSNFQVFKASAAHLSEENK